MDNKGERINFVINALNRLTGLRVALCYRPNDIGVELVTTTGLVVGVTNIRVNDDPKDDSLFGTMDGAFTIKDLAPDLDKIRDDYATIYGAKG